MQTHARLTSDAGCQRPAAERIVLPNSEVFVLLGLPAESVESREHRRTIRLHRTGAGLGSFRVSLHITFWVVRAPVGEPERSALALDSSRFCTGSGACGRESGKRTGSTG